MSRRGLKFTTPTSRTIVDFVNWSDAGVYAFQAAYGHALLAAIWTPGDFYASTEVSAIGLNQPVMLRIQVNPPPGNAIIVHAMDQNHRDIGTFVSQRTGEASSSLESCAS